MIETVHGRGYRFIAPVRTPVPPEGPGVLGAPRAVPSPHVRRPQHFVGREAALTQMMQWWATAQQGTRQVGVIAGEPGIGKTALVEAFLAPVVATEPIWVGHGQCVDHYGPGEPYLPVLEALGRLCRGPEGPGLVAVLRQYAPSWLVQMPALVPPAEWEARQRTLGHTGQTRMLRELTDALDALTAERLLVLVLEDLHWSDRATLEWLAYVARRPDPARLLILGTYRPVDTIVYAHPLRTVLTELQQHGQCAELALDYLSADEVTAYLRQRFGNAELAADLARVLHQRTHGNPLFLIAVMDELVRQQVVREGPAGGALQGGVEAIPTIIPAKHILFIMDVCYSGLAMQRVVAPGTDRFLSDMLQRRARQVLTAGKADETVADGGGPQGKSSIFTGYLLEGLSGAASHKNGVLTANALMYYVYQRVGQDGRSQQTPHYGHIDGDGDCILRTPGDEHLRPDAQGDLLVETTPEMPELISVITSTASPTFAQKNGYADPTHPSFGRNDWSKMLGEQRFVVNAPREIVRAFSWLSLIVEPASNRAITIDIAEKASHLPHSIPADAKPHERFPVPRERRTTANSLALYDEWVLNPQLWRYYLRFDKAGNIEYACTGLLMAEDQRRGVRYFCYVTLIGIIWQFLFWAKNFLVSASYTSGIRLLVNLAGTRDTILAQFSRELAEGNRVWPQPLDNSFGIDTGVYDLIKCRDPHLQLEYQLVIGSLTETEAQQLIENIARKLRLAYNHNSSPRCFNANTNVFPWNTIP